MYSGWIRERLKSYRRGPMKILIVGPGAMGCLFSARLAIAGYNVTLLQYDVARNMLFEKYNINVNKYIPKDTK